MKDVQKKIEQVLGLIADIVDDIPGTFKEKGDRIKATAAELGDREEEALEEFVTWFPEEE